MTKILLIPVICILTNYSHCQTKLETNKEFNTPTIMIWGEDYSIPKKKYEKTKDYFIEGKGFKIFDSINFYVVRPIFEGGGDFVRGGEHYIDFKKINKNDTILIERRYYEIIEKPKPLIIWGDFNDSHIRISNDSIEQLREIKLINSWSTDFTKPKIKSAFVYFKNESKTFEIINQKLSDDFLNELVSRDSSVVIVFGVHYFPKKGYVSSIVNEYNVHVLGKQNLLRYNDKYYDLHLNKHVEILGTWSIEAFDTLTFDNSKNDLFIHCLGLGTEDEIILQSIESDKKFTFTTIHREGEAILEDMRNIHGTFNVNFWGDSGSGEMILIIK